MITCGKSHKAHHRLILLIFGNIYGVTLLNPIRHFFHRISCAKFCAVVKCHLKILVHSNMFSRSSPWNPTTFDRLAFKRIPLIANGGLSVIVCCLEEAINARIKPVGRHGNAIGVWRVVLHDVAAGGHDIG